MLTKASQSTQGLTKTYLYNNDTELTKMTASEYGGTTRDYTYEQDMAGRLTRQVQNVFSPDSTTTFNYEWDALDRMTKVQRVASGVTKTINYTWFSANPTPAEDGRSLRSTNAAGLRARRVDTSTNVTKLWTYQGNNIASVQESSGGSYGAADYVYTVGPGMINNVTERHLHTDTGADSWYYQYDHRGNVVAVTDYSGKILRGYQYDAFGNIPFSFATGQSGAAPTDDILFTGKDLDPDTGLYYFNARWYDSDTGRFTIRAPLLPDKEHSYAFCENNPMNLSDPAGLDSYDDDYDPYGRRKSKGSLVELLNGPNSCFPKAIKHWSLDLLAWFETNKTYEDSRTGGPRNKNAMRHCVWQCLLTYYCGKRVARAAGWWHELGRPDDADHRADVHNNTVGQIYSLAATSASDCYCLCKRALDKGYLDTR